MANSRPSSISSLEDLSLVRLISSDSNGKLARGGSLRSRRGNGPSELPAPLGDYQSDEVLNARPPISPRSGRPMSSDRVERVRVSSPLQPRTELAVPAGGSTGRRTPTIPISNPGFMRIDAEWTRENWAERKVALVTGITGQDGSYLAERESRDESVTHCSPT